MIYILFFLLLTFYMLTHSETSLYYAFHGLTLWYHKMVPTLLPFMILSGTLVRMNLTEKFVMILHPALKRLFRCNPNVSYGILMGFLCGFPMGARVASDLLVQRKITKTEADFLLSFNNNIGPVYFCSFVIPALGITNILPSLSAMYGIPLIYGIFLRYTVYRKSLNDSFEIKNKDQQLKRSPLNIKSNKCGLLTALDESVKSGINSISMLCGYMIIFNLLNILPHYFLPEIQKYISPLLEITGGIGLNSYASPYYILILLPFGGLSCIAQTNSIIRDTGLSVKKYALHKLVITGITAIYYVIFFVLQI